MVIQTFFCSACFRPSYSLKESIGRESFNCHWCKATSRERAILLQIHKHYILKKLKNPFRNLKILGVSDGYLTSTILSKLYREKYTNFHYHLAPKLDITSVSIDAHASADIISCSEVLEHVEPPIQKAFEGLFHLLRPNGVLVLSVPHTDANGQHVEHFPILTESRISKRESGFVLQGKNVAGEEVTFDELTFHGGVGATLEYRIFSQGSLMMGLVSSGFKILKIGRNNLFFGINWEPWSRVWTVTK